MARLGCRLWVVLAVWTACARGSAGGGATTAGFAVEYPDAPPTGVAIKRGTRFYANPNATCVYENGREARWTMSSARVASGELPPGLTFEDGVIGGVPTTAGTYRATLELSNLACAGEKYGNQTVDIQITVK